MGSLSRPSLVFVAVAFLVLTFDANSAHAQSNSRRCNSCIVNGETHEGHSRFQYQEGCFKYRCLCYCNGTWECPAQHTLNTCDPNKNNGNTEASSEDSSREGRCKSCQVAGQKHLGNSFFTHVDGCVTYDRCVCYCNGTWVCPASRARNTCNDGNSAGSNTEREDESRRLSVESRRPEDRQRSDCYGCKIKEKEFRGNSYFQLEEECWRFKYCFCHCNGTWNCPQKYSENVCEDNEETKQPSDCRSCSVKGKTFEGNSAFEMTSNCIHYKNCQCNCDGSWTCPESGARRVCERDSTIGESDSSPSCRTCDVKGKQYPGNKPFEFTDGCIEYKNCICNCDGSWNCPDSGAKNICAREATDSSASEDRCRKCEVRGKQYPGNRPFEFTEGCIEYKNCICNCDGSWNCPDSDAKNICAREATDSSASEDRCRKCEVRGKQYPGNRPFEFTDGCIEYKNCICNCDGSWNCPDSGAKNICAREATDSSASEDRCRKCEVRGKQYPGNRPFEFTDGCIEYKNCICNCDGSWNCPDSGAKNICAREATDSSASEDRCRRCEVRGKQYPGNKPFEFTEGCIEYKNCICNCDGSWNCPDSGAKNICAREATDSSASEDRCRKCEVRGKQYPGNRPFEFTEGCIEYKSCICNCDGSWNCPDSGAKNICKEENKRPASNSCKKCNVKGQEFPDNDYFDYKDGCTEYRNCICNCDGSWACPPNAAKNVCEPTEVACKTCEVYGMTFPGNDYFNVKQGCYDYRNCICYCNGSWICPENSARYTCSSQAPTRQPTTVAPRQPAAQCSTCSVYGQRFRGNSKFEVTSGCVNYRNCVCRCDGSWQCPSSSAINICTAEARTETTPRPTASNQCQMCNAKNKLVKGNEYFDLRDGCKEYKHCFCRCDGSWQCPPQYARNICQGSTQVEGESNCRSCQAKGKIVKGNSYFNLTEECLHYRDCRCHCDGSWQCPAQRAQNICFNNNADRSCSMCQASDGNVYQPNSKFQFTQDCIQYSCDCFCNGSWNCPAQKSRWVCTDKCLQCDVKGRKVQNDTVFTHKTGCLEYTCNCFCNGSWSCPGNTVRNTCPVGVNDNCNKCIVGSEEYIGETDFVLRKDCLHYKCRCNCDGSYSCPGKDARNVCRGETLGGCRSCVVSDSEYYKGETSFNLRKDCINFSCRCNCDGSWSCPSELARDVCLGEVPGGCRVCRVSESERHAANSVFDLRKGCINYRCKCKCDGSWSCPGEDARDICKGEVPGGCRSCVISENEFYPGNSNFEMVKNCMHYKCRCNCDGSYNCPGKHTRRVCKAEGDVGRPTCRTCKISESEQFNGNSTFYLERSCNRYECTCNCDGSWACPASKTRDICNRASAATQCKPCKIGTEVYPGNSAFKFTRRCNQFDCTCACNGRWSCDHKRPVNICASTDDSSKTLKFSASNVQPRQSISSSIDASGHSVQSGVSNTETDIRSQQRERALYAETTPRPAEFSNCRQCVVEGKVIRQNVPFSFARGCIHYRNCLCNCNGSWQCEEETDTCFGGASQRDRNVNPSRKNTVEIDSSAWVYVDGKDSSYVKSTDDRTGGGYAVQIDAKYRPVEAPEASPYDRHGQLDSRSTVVTSGASPQRSSSYSVSHSYTREESEDRSQCQNCEVDSKTYRAGALFDMHRECVIYKCTCLCNGNYRCRLTSDNTCTSEKKQSSCGNCVFKGLVFPGNRGFTVRDGCFEKECQCKCDGTHECHKSSPIDPCTPESPQSAMFPGYLPMLPPGFISQTGNVLYTSSCTNCGSGGNGDSGFALVPIPGYRPGRECSGCFIEGIQRAGNATFSFVKDCTEFNCYCACGGSWKCSGVQSLTCSTGYEARTNPHESGCRTCNVKGTEYPGNARFTLLEGCNEYQCSCSCSGHWSCPQQQPVNICPQEPRRGRELDPLTAREDPYAADQGVERRSYQALGELRQSDNNDNVKSTKESNCFQCKVQGETYPPNSKFVHRDGCLQRVCDCHCDSSWSCPNDEIVDICKAEAAEKAKSRCRDCRIQDEVFTSENDFQWNAGCYQYSCHCFCNGSFVCPAETARNTCSARAVDSRSSLAQSSSSSASARVSVGDAPPSPRLQSTVLAIARSEFINEASFPGCKQCDVDGQKVAPLSTFIRQLGCYETVCNCLCNGTPSCPQSSSVNTCFLPDKKPMNERKGCTVGNRTFLTRVFPLTENCRERTCVCHDDGTYNCLTSAEDRKVC
ncbi:balbiani ring protein 3-like [Biomphalaria glabrata]|uniref:Balbiani ring protein 3-like n=1 Tax=Biomphalaria glabrata TaxID=6526 RepID=A0A9W3ARG6_BIOGL|nr:balbiani ring protein 3-like [Biomphalaria glabrata]